MAFYVLLDRVSYFEPLFGLDITPWNPGPAFGLVCWLVYGKRTAIPWFLALVVSEFVTRNLPEGRPATLILSGCLVLGYGAIGEALRRFFKRAGIFQNRRMLFIWLSVVVSGTLVNSLIYISLLYLLGYIPQGNWFLAYWNFWVGDVVGIVITMPLFWLMLSKAGRAELSRIIFQRETAAYLALSVGLLWLVFGIWGSSELAHFYLLFVPLIWAAARQGVVGASLEAFFLQIAFLVIVEGVLSFKIPIVELQLLAAVLGTTTFFIGVMVDEHRQVSRQLKQTIRLASAGEMTAALAHELNQPMAALLLYAKACEELMARGEAGELLKKAVHQMIGEASRATEVVRRLRDFFRSGSLQFESVDLNRLLVSAVQPFLERAQRQQTALYVPETPSVSLLVDSLQIELVLHNLLTNALESVATIPVDFRRVSVTTEVLVGHRICITVEDSGPGVSEALSEQLFEPFSSNKPTGLGLGLVISKAIAEGHGGSLQAEISDRGIFRLVLPITERGRHAIT